AWEDYMSQVKTDKSKLLTIYSDLEQGCTKKAMVVKVREQLEKLIDPMLSEVVKNARIMQIEIGHEKVAAVEELKAWLARSRVRGHKWYHTHLYSSSDDAALKVPVVQPVYSEKSPTRSGFQILNAFFDKQLQKNPAFFAFGEDVGHIGGVNQGFAGLQEKYGEERVFDTGIREWTIVRSEERRVGKSGGRGGRRSMRSGRGGRERGMRGRNA